MSRLFFALWPDQEIRNKIANISQALPQQSGRLIAQHNWHLTLVFLGHVEKDNIHRLLSESVKIKASRFSIQLDQLGWWSRPKVLWLAPSVFPQQLSSLVDEIAAMAKDCELVLEDRPYRPHVTLVRKAKADVKDIMFAPISWDITGFSLLESISDRSGVRYQVIETWPLLSD